MANLDALAQLDSLREELGARKELAHFESRGLPAPDFLRDKIREPSLSELVRKLNDSTHIIDGETRVEAVEVRAPIRARVVDHSASVALICHSWDLVASNGGWQLLVHPFLCRERNQNFVEQGAVLPRDNTPATGFVVGRGRFVLTARHAALDSNRNLRPNLRCVFGYTRSNEVTQLDFPAAAVIAVKSVAAYGTQIDDDWALLELAVDSGHQGLPLRNGGARSNSVLAMGYPHGLPLKVGEGTARDGISPSFFEATLDIGAGNSGSPVFSMDTLGQPSIVEGMVIEAPDDIRALPDRCTACRESKPCAVWVQSCGQEFSTCWARIIPMARMWTNAAFKQAVEA